MPLLRPIPPSFFVCYSVFLIVTNNWMHMNTTWRSSWLEWVVVTPRYHHVHHGTTPDCYRRNFGVVFSIWDRLFGTYGDPEAIPADFWHPGAGPSWAVSIGIVDPGSCTPAMKREDS